MRLLKKLDIFVLKNFLVLFLGTFCISLFVVMLQFLWKYIDDLVGKGLGIDVLGKFFFYAAETLVPTALPLAVLLASLISFGNMGERLELLAIKAAGVSLFRTLRPLAILMAALALVNYYFLDVIAPHAYDRLMQLRYSMQQKSPELSIPEGVFYDGVEGMNLYVRSKDKETGMLRQVIIYNMRDGVNKAHIILADSGLLQTSADKRHLLLSLYSGEQFENLSNNPLRTNNVPYRRETFVEKNFIIDFDQNFNMADVDFSNSARTKSIVQLQAGIDSLRGVIDSTSHAFFNDMRRGVLYVGGADAAPRGERADAGLDVDTAYARLSVAEKIAVMRGATQSTMLAVGDLDFKNEVMESYQRNLRLHRIQIWQKITQALSCLIFFFIGAPLGAIIRKGGLGMPVVVAVVIFLFYYIIDRLGYNLAYAGTIPPLVGMWVSSVVLAPMGVFLTVKSNNDSTLFNLDSYRSFFRALWGLRTKRHIVRKEVIINTPDYAEMADALERIVADARDYRNTQRLTRFPNYLKVFFHTERDERIEDLSQQLEYCVEVLSNSRNRRILRDLNAFPVLDAHAHTVPFRNPRLNMAAGVVFPAGIVLLFRIARFRRRLRRDLRQIAATGESMARLCRDEAIGK